ncbi:MAG: hypothetical protein FJZ07_02600, partial [Candidatus Nealsonbacteria bacterium]|nr:hypothetical protein [Candidatus Nealsonbacteria bacterium]
MTVRIFRSKGFYFYLNLIIRIVLVIAFGIALWEQNWLNAFLSLLTLFLTFLPFIVKKRHKLELPEEIQLVIILFIYAGIFLGGVSEFYYRFWWWDSLLHAVGGIGLGFAGFLILYSLYQSGKLETSPFLIALFSFCFALAIGALWEIFEFVMDSFFGFNMQEARGLEKVYGYFDTRLGLLDTIWDLILDSFGALVASFSGYLYLKNKEVFLFDKIVKRFEKKNPLFFKKKEGEAGD